MDLKKYHRAIVEHLQKQPWIYEHELEELDASVSHWLQSPEIDIPCFSNSMRLECNSVLQNSQSEDSKYSLSVLEEQSSYQMKLDLLFKDLPYPPPHKWNFTFIDLFAGIGGFRLAFQDAGGKCIFSSEWDKFAKLTYEANFGEYPYGDIRKLIKSEIPDHDILCAGFPCQPFSLAGVSKKKSLGRKHGFEDKTQGTLFFEIKEILRIKRPKAFMLENVKNLLSHDKGITFEVIRHALENILGYVINWKVVDGANWVPQHRERVFIVGYDPKQISIDKDDILIPSKPSENYNYPYLKNIILSDVDGFTLGPGTWDTLKRHKAHHQKMGNGFGYALHKLPVKDDEVTRTISARYHKDGAEVLIEQTGNRPRRLTIEEALQLQGYDPEIFIMPVSNTQAYRQIGNSVVVPAVKACALNIAKVLKSSGQ